MGDQGHTATAPVKTVGRSSESSVRMGSTALKSGTMSSRNDAAGLRAGFMACLATPENLATKEAALRYALEGSGHFDATPIVQYGAPV